MKQVTIHTNADGSRVLTFRRDGAPIATAHFSARAAAELDRLLDRAAGEVAEFVVELADD